MNLLKHYEIIKTTGGYCYCYIDEKDYLSPDQDFACDLPEQYKEFCCKNYKVESWFFSGNITDWGMC